MVIISLKRYHIVSSLLSFFSNPWLVWLCDFFYLFSSRWIILTKLLILNYFSISRISQYYDPYHAQSVSECSPGEGSMVWYEYHGCFIGFGSWSLSSTTVLIAYSLMDHGQRNDLTHNLSKVYTGLGWQV